MSSKTNDKGQYIYYGKVAGCIITGNEDGIKHCAMGLLYAMKHVGYSIPPRPVADGLVKWPQGPAMAIRNGRTKNSNILLDSTPASPTGIPPL